MDTTATAAIDAGDLTLLARFERGELSPTELDHRTHLRLAWASLQREADLAAGALVFRRALRRHVAAHGAAHRYHETITWVYLCVLEQHRAADPALPFAELLRRAPDLLDPRGGALARHYDVAALASCRDAARAFVLPARGTP